MTRKIIGKVIDKVLLCFLSLLAILICYSIYSVWSFGEVNQLVRTDAAIVLGAAVWGDQPSPALKERINHAIWLYQKGYIQKIIFTGGIGDQKTMSEAEVSRNYALENQVKPEDILMESKSRTTEDNLRYAYEVAKQSDLKTFTIVSDPYHMKRAIVIAEDLGMKVYSSPTPTTVFRSFKTKWSFFWQEWYYYINYQLNHSS